MDRMGADFFNTVKMIVSNLAATPAVLQVCRPFALDPTVYNQSVNIFNVLGANKQQFRSVNSSRQSFFPTRTILYNNHHMH